MCSKTECTTTNTANTGDNDFGVVVDPDWGGSIDGPSVEI